MVDKKLTWKVKESRGNKKNANWYWAIGVLAVGGAIASAISGNGLLSLLILLGGFAVMIAGSRPATEHVYSFSEVGVHVDSSIVTWDKIQKFCIDEKDTKRLTLETQTLWGTMVIPLLETNYSEIETELKNRNIEEADSLETFAEGITKGLGL